LGFLFFLLKGTGSLAGYDLNQVIFFFLTFNFIDIVSQFLFREVYRFRQQIVSGSFDLTLTRPMNPLFRSLMGGADVLDLFTIPPLIVALFYVGQLISPSFFQIILYLLLVANGLLIAAAFHIAVIALGIITLEIDHTIMIYRDLKDLGKLPIDIYKEPLKSVITYLVPVGVMVTLPVKVLIGLISPVGIVGSLALGLSTILISIKFWNYALKYYTSASS